MRRTHLLCIALLALCLFGGCLAGIAGFNAWLLQTFPESMRPLTRRGETDHLLIDMNSILYKATKRCAFDMEHGSSIVKHVLARVNAIMAEVRPRKSVALAFDGPAPYSKVRLQRSRRLADPPSATSNIDQLLITPGTTTMTKFTEAIIDHCARRMRPSQPTFFVSTSEFPGEGELKVLEWMSTFVKDPIHESIVLCGDDSDLVLQCMAYTGFPNLHVLTSIPKNTNAPKAKTSKAAVADVNVRQSPRFRMLERASLLKEIMARVQVNEENLSRDLIFLWALNGNDYLPKLRGVSFDVLFESYVQAMNNLPPEKRGLFQSSDVLQPNWLAMKALFDILAKEYRPPLRSGNPLNPIQLVEECTRDKKVPAMNLVVTSRPAAKSNVAEFCAMYCDPTTNATLFESTWERSDKTARWKASEAVLFASPDINAEYLQAIYNNEVVGRLLSGSAVPWEESSPAKISTFLSGILWMMKMYMTGSCSDTSYYYPWGYAPSADHVAAWIEQHLHNTTSVTDVQQEQPFADIAIPTSNLPYLSPVAVAMTVLPWTNITDQRMLPQQLHHTWHAAQEELFDHPSIDFRTSPFGSTYKSPLPSMAYQDVISRLDRIFQNATYPQEAFKWGPMPRIDTRAPAVPLHSTSKWPVGTWYAVSRGNSLQQNFRLRQKPEASAVFPPKRRGDIPVTVWHIPAFAALRAAQQRRSPLSAHANCNSRQRHFSKSSHMARSAMAASANRRPPHSTYRSSAREASRATSIVRNRHSLRQTV